MVDVMLVQYLSTVTVTLQAIYMKVNHKRRASEMAFHWRADNDSTPGADIECWL